MLKISSKITGLDKLQKEIKKLEQLISLNKYNEWNTFLKSKVMALAQDITNEYLVGGTTNDMAIEKYKSSHHIKNTDNGFILYNDCTIMADSKNPSTYPNEEFNIALAFEYGVGIVGEGTYDKGKTKFKPWEYNVNKYNFGWKYPTENGDYLYDTTYGYQGFEIYRHIAEESQNNMQKWYNEYMEKEA